MCMWSLSLSLKMCYCTILALLSFVMKWDDKLPMLCDKVRWTTQPLCCRIRLLLSFRRIWDTTVSLPGTCFSFFASSWKEDSFFPQIFPASGYDFFPSLIKSWTSTFSLTGITSQLLFGIFGSITAPVLEELLGSKMKVTRTPARWYCDSWYDDLGYVVSKGTKGESHPTQDGVGRRKISSCYSGQRAVSNVWIASFWNVPLNTFRQWLTMGNWPRRKRDCR